MAPSSAPVSVSPVTFPPGRARLFTMPFSTSASAAPTTMGMVGVAYRAARAPGVVWVKMTSGRHPTSSLARAGNRS